jgi:hypothetical protein
MLSWGLCAHFSHVLASVVSSEVCSQLDVGWDVCVLFYVGFYWFFSCISPLSVPISWSLMACLHWIDYSTVLSLYRSDHFSNSLYILFSLLTLKRHLLGQCCEFWVTSVCPQVGWPVHSVLSVALHSIHLCSELILGCSYVFYWDALFPNPNSCVLSYFAKISTTENPNLFSYQVISELSPCLPTLPEKAAPVPMQHAKPSFSGSSWILFLYQIFGVGDLLRVNMDRQSWRGRQRWKAVLGSYTIGTNCPG